MGNTLIVEKDLVDVSSALASFSSYKSLSSALPEGDRSAVLVDLSAVKTVNSTGLATFLLCMNRFLNGREHTVACSRELAGRLEALKAFERPYGLSHNSPRHPPANCTADTYSLIHQFVFKKPSVDEGADDEFMRTSLFEKHFINLPVYKKFDSRKHAFIMLIWEICANIPKHAVADGILGLDSQVTKNGGWKVPFVLGDFGPGIQSNVRQYFPESKALLPGIAGFAKAYHTVIPYGKTSKPGQSQGTGMDVICMLAKAGKIKLDVYDANFKARLSKLTVQSAFDGPARWPTVKEIKDVTMDLGHDAGFFYHGEMDIPQR